jgi:hypothetical protein
VILHDAADAFGVPIVAIDARIDGVRPVQEAADAAVVITRGGLSELVKDKPWADRLVAALGNIVLALQGVDSATAIDEFAQKMISGQVSSSRWNLCNLLRMPISPKWAAVELRGDAITRPHPKPALGCSPRW